jgi:peptidyl-prolyl cis-trans isomerase D
MLQGIRDRAHGWLAWVVVLLISVPFALWGIQEYLGNDADAPVVTVNGLELGLPQFQRAYAQQKAHLEALLGSNLDRKLFDEGQFKQAALEQLIEGELLVQAARRNGLRISDAQLAQSIQRQRAFQERGAFSDSLYTNWLRAQGYSSAGFEQDLRRSLATHQISAGVTQSVIVTGRDVQKMLRLVGQQRRFADLRISADDSRQKLDVSQSNIESYYQKHLAQYRTPERVKIAYLELSREAIEETITASDEELLRLYQAEHQRDVVPERRRASHILVSIPEDADAAAVAAAQSRAEELRSRLEKGEKFEALAKEVSDDPGSSGSGGDLGFFGRGVMDKSFEDAVYSMKVGEISQPVRSAYGFHLIRLSEIQPAQERSFEEMRTDLLRRYKQQRAEPLFFEQTEQLANLAFEYPENLEVAAETLGLSIKVTEPFDRQGRKGDTIIGRQEVLDAAFSPEVLEDGANSELIDIDGDRVVVLRVKEHFPAAQRSLSEVRNEIIETIQGKRARERVVAIGRNLIARLRAGEEPADLAESLHFEWSAPRTIKRDETSVAAEIRDALFRMPHPAANEREYDGILSSSGDFVILSLELVVDGDPAAAKAQYAQSLKDTLYRDYGQENIDSLVQSLQQQAEVEVHRDRI